MAYGWPGSASLLSSITLDCCVVAAVPLFGTPDPLLSSLFTQTIPALAASSGLFNRPRCLDDRSLLNFSADRFKRA